MQDLKFSQYRRRFIRPKRKLIVTNTDGQWILVAVQLSAKSNAQTPPCPLSSPSDVESPASHAPCLGYLRGTRRVPKRWSSSSAREAELIGKLLTEQRGPWRTLARQLSTVGQRISEMGSMNRREAKWWGADSKYQIACFAPLGLQDKVCAR